MLRFRFALSVAPKLRLEATASVNKNTLDRPSRLDVPNPKEGAERDRERDCRPRGVLQTGRSTDNNTPLHTSLYCCQHTPVIPWKSVVLM